MCRETAMAVVDAVEQPTLKQILELLEGHRDTLLALDRSFLLEMLWIKQAMASGAHAKLEAEILKIFEGANRSRTLQEALEALNDLERATIYHLCASSSKAMTVTCKTWVQQLLRGVCPDGLEESDGFLANIINRCAS